MTVALADDVEELTLLTVEQAAELLNVRPTAIRVWIGNRVLRAARLPTSTGTLVNGQFRVRRDDVMALLKELN